MYKAKLNDEILYHPNAEDSGQIVEGTFTESLNKSGAFEFTVNQDNVVYSKAQKMQDHVYLYRYSKPGKEKLLFEGRVVSDSKDFDNLKTVTCEGALGYLLDSVQRPYVYQHVTPEELFRNLIASHNESVSEDKRFVVGIVDVNGEEIKVTEAGYPKTFDDIEDKLINVYGGYISVRYANGIRYIDYRKESGRKLDKPIRFGVNMMDLEEVIEAGDVKTVLIPIGNENSATGKPITIKSVNDDKDYLENTEAIKIFGRIEDTFKVSSDSPKAILKAGQEEIASISNMAVSIEVTAIDLADTGIDIEDVRAGDWIPVISKRHGIDSVMQVTSREIDLMKPENSKIVLGASIRTLTRTQDQEENSIRKEMTILKETADGKIEEARGELGELKNDHDDFKQNTEEDLTEVKQETENNKTIAESAQEAANQATQDAQEAKEAADNANNSATIAQENAQLSAEAAANAQASADTANATAEEAKTTASAAQKAADEANAQVSIINGEISFIKEDQTAIREEMSAEITAITETMEASYAKKTDVSTTEMNLRAEFTKSAAEIQSTMESDYAKKTDLTDVQSNLQTQITQNATNITSTASAVEEVKVDATDAKNKASEAVQTASDAQTKAQTAVTAANEAQSAADTANLAAQNAQAEATKAAKDADTAKTAADDAKAVADAAQVDLDAAKQNLTDVTNRVDATEEEIQAAQVAVDVAQQKADEANASAESAQAAAEIAQSAADTAKQNAATAQATADEATANAAAAQTAADNAKAEADKANAAVNNLANTVTEMDTKIDQNAEAIKLTATKTEVKEYLSGYSTKEETESAINVASSSILTEVRASIGNISGGDNILRGTNVETELDANGLWTEGKWRIHGSGSATFTEVTDPPLASLNKSWKLAGSVYPSSKYGGIQQVGVELEPGSVYTVSCYAKKNPDAQFGGNLQVLVDSEEIGTKSISSDTWTRVSFTFTASAATAAIVFSNNDTVFSIYVCGMTLNKGDKDSGWTPAVYDIGDSATALRASLELKVDKTALISEINASADIITLTGNRFIVDSDNFKLSADGTMEAVNGVFSGTLDTKEGVIGGFTIGEDFLEFDSDSYYIQITNNEGLKVAKKENGAITNTNTLVVRDGGIYAGLASRISAMEETTESGTGILAKFLNADSILTHEGLDTVGYVKAGKDIILNQNDTYLSGVDANIKSIANPVRAVHRLIGINSSNNILVGHSATGDAREGNTQIYATNGYVRLFAGDGTATGELRMAYNDTYDFRLAPTTAGKGMLGSTTYYFYRAYASLAQWTPSDRRKKTNIRSFDRRFVDMYDELEPVLFELTDTDVGRSHFGMIAQDVENAMQKYGIDASECGFFEYDSESDMYGLVYQELAPYNTLMIQETRKKVDSAEARAEVLSYMIEQAFERISILEKENKELKQALA